MCAASAESSIAHNLASVRRRIAQAALRAGRDPAAITLVPISKGVEVARILAGCRAGIEHVGENRVQEAEGKFLEVSRQGVKLTWHMVGHLQTNKVKTALEIFGIIHSVDSLRLAESLNRNALRPIPILLEVNVAAEATKSGFTIQELSAVTASIARLERLDLIGLMTVAPLVEDPEEVRPVFRRLRGLRDALGLRELSMGMTGDFEVAVEEGATLVRIGRAIFGERRD